MECLAPLLLFVPRLRWLGALGLTGFHIGIHLCMTVNWFLPIAVIGAGVAMLPDWLLQRLDHRMVPLFSSLRATTAGKHALRLRCERPFSLVTPAFLCYSVATEGR